MAVTDPQLDVSVEVVHASAPAIERAHVSDARVLPRSVKLGLWIAIALFLLLAQQVFVYTPDDTFITFRYAKNLAAGYGPVFNRNAPLSDRTEGYSCPLFMFLMAVLWKLPLGLDMLLRAKFLGIVCALATLVVAQRLARRLGLPVWAQAATPLLLAIHPYFVVMSVDGMETVLAALLTLLAVYWFVGEWEAERSGSQRVGFGSAFALAGCALTRPEGMLFGLMALGLLVVGKRGRLNGRDARWLLALLVPVGLFLLWRHAYYGLWLPNTYYAKNPPLEAAVVRGSLYLLNTFFTFIYRAYYLPFAIGWWLLVLAGAASDRFRRPPMLLGSLFILVQIAHILRSGGDWMTGWRYMGPVLPLLMLLSVAGIVEIGEGVQRLGKASGPKLARAAIGALCAFHVTACLISYKEDYWRGVHNGLVSWASKGFTLKEREMLRGWGIERAIHLSEWLNARLPPGSVVVYTEMGLTPYLSPQLRFLDARGLNDYGVATLPGALRNLTGVTDRYESANTAVGRYLAGVRKPEYILAGAVVPKGARLDPQEPILEGRYRPYAEFELARFEPGKTTIMRLWRYQISGGIPSK